jgi:hypothetical protein
MPMVDSIEELNALPQCQHRHGRLHRLTLTNLADINHGTGSSHIDGEPAGWECTTPRAKQSRMASSTNVDGACPRNVTAANSRVRG